MDAAATLLAAGADPNIWVDGCFSAFHHAIELGNLDMIRLLLAHGADVNHSAEMGLTPLVHAIDVECDPAWQMYHEVGRETTEVTELLLSSGAIPTERAYTQARNYHSVKMVQFMDGWQGRGKATD